MIPMIFSEVRVTAVADTPVLLLRELHGTRYLAIWITAAGGNAILSALDDVEEDHPSTHDLMLNSLSVLDAVVQSVRITGFHEGVYESSISVGGSVVTARVSDAVALALRSGATILAAEDLLDEVGVGGARVRPTPERAAGGRPDEQMERFRAFLDSINPEDFDPSPGQP